MKLVNTTRQRRRLEIITYAEVVLTPQNAEVAHPAFSNLFVQTEIVRDKQAILCTRRPRHAGHDAQPWFFHRVTIKGQVQGEISFETDRARFLGRGNALPDAYAFKSNTPLTGTAGAVLDPIVAIRRTFEIDPSGHIEFDFVTGAAENRDAALMLVDKFQDHRLCERAFEVAWTHSKVVLNQLNATESDAQIYYELAAPIIHASPEHRAPSAILFRNQRGQSGLWGYGISGDFPILLLKLQDVTGIDLAREALRAHALLRMKGLAFDLVIWNEDASTYRQTLHDSLMGVVLTGPDAGLLDHPGGIFIRRGDQIAEDDRVLLQTLARVTLQEGRGRLSEQIERHVLTDNRQPRFVRTRLAPRRAGRTPPFRAERFEILQRHRRLLA